MKRIFTVFLTVCLAFTMTVSVFSDEIETPSYYRMPVYLTDYDYSIDVDFMIPADGEGVYVNAEHLANLSGRYNYKQTHTQGAFADDVTDHAVLYKFASKDVVVYLFDKTLSYTAPMESIYFGGVAWIPFEFGLNMLGCEYSIDDETIYFSGSKLNALTAAAAVLNEENSLAFDWVDEVGYSSFSVFMMSTSASAVNFFQGLFTGDTWGALLSSITNLSGVYDKERTEDIADLFVAPSSDEVSGFADTFTEEYLSGALKKIFSDASSVNQYFNEQNPSKGISSALKALQKKKPGLDKSGQLSKLIKTVDKVGEKIDSKTGLAKKFYDGASLEIKTSDGVIDNMGFSIFDITSYFFDICSYYEKFSEADDTAKKALKHYAKNSDLDESRFFTGYVNNIDTPWVGALEQYLSENVHTMVLDGTSGIVQSFMGAPAFLAIGWNFLSSNVPYIKNSLDSTQKFSLSEMAIYFQEESLEMLHDSINECFASGGTVSQSDLEALTQNAYAYCKFSMIARNVAADSVNAGAELDSWTKSQITKRLETNNKKIADNLSYIVEGDCGMMPGMYLGSRFDYTMLKNTLELYGERIPASSMYTSPIMEMCPFPGDDEDYITAEEAEALVHEVMSGYSMGMMDMMDSLMGGVYDFQYIDMYAVDEKTPAYVIQMTTGGNVESSLFFVPYYGDVVWMGSYSSDGYYCYTGLDLNDMSLGSIFTSIGDLTGQILEEVNK